jgi:hypothetical protein
LKKVAGEDYNKFKCEGVVLYGPEGECLCKFTNVNELDKLFEEGKATPELLSHIHAEKEKALTNEYNNPSKDFPRFINFMDYIDGLDSNPNREKVLEMVEDGITDPNEYKKYVSLQEFLDCYNLDSMTNLEELGIC